MKQNLFISFFKAKNEKKLNKTVFLWPGEKQLFWGLKIKFKNKIPPKFHFSDCSLKEKEDIHKFSTTNIILQNENLAARARGKICRFFGIKLIKIIAHRQQCVHFWKSQTNWNHSTLLHIKGWRTEGEPRF